MIRKIVAILLALWGIVLGSAGIVLALTNIESKPVLVEVPVAAREQALSVMDALCKGDYAAVQQALYGQPELGMDRVPADAVGVLLFEAYGNSLHYQLQRDCYVTDKGIAMDVTVTALDISSITKNLQQRTKALLEERVEQTADASTIYAAGGEYREEFVMEVLYDAAVQALQEDADTVTTDLTLECVFENGQWWIVSTDALLKVISCGYYR